MSNLKDFATSTVLTPPSPADSGTSLVVQSGHGARFPTTPFYAVVHPPSEFPTLDNAEKVQVTSKSTDTFTITRGEGDTSPLEIEAGWRISNALFLDDIPDTFDDLTDGSTNKAFTSTLKTKLDGIETAADVTDATNVAAAGAVMESDTSTASMSFVVDEDDMSSNSATKLATQQSIKAYVDAAITATKAALYPVGSIYVNEGNSTNPATLLGFGTWTAFSAGRMLVGYNSGDADFDTSGETGGAKTHYHQVPLQGGYDSSRNYLYSAAVFEALATAVGASIYSKAISSKSRIAQGSLSSANIEVWRLQLADTNHMNPYTTVYMWKRTA